MKGKRIVVTRAPHQAGELADLLRAHGAEVLLYPCIAIVPPEETSLLDDALRKAAAGEFDWLVLTSANTVEALRQRCGALGLSLRGTQAAAVGPATARSARELLEVNVQIVPEEFAAEVLAVALQLAPGTRVFLPQADIARTVLHDQLAAAGADVTVIDFTNRNCGLGCIFPSSVQFIRSLIQLFLLERNRNPNLLTRFEFDRKT